MNRNGGSAETVPEPPTPIRVDEPINVKLDEDTLDSHPYRVDEPDKPHQLYSE